eukprot:gene4181-4429_t
MRPADLDKATAQIAWLQDHGSLVSTLETSFSKLAASHLTAATAALVSSLNAAATASPGLYLQNVSFIDVDSNLASLLLQQLPAKHLTSLELETVHMRPGDAGSTSTGRPQYDCAKSLGRALAGLTKLESLYWQSKRLGKSQQGPRLDDHNPMEDRVLAALPALTALTRLVLAPCSKQQLSFLQQLTKLDDLTLQAVLYCPDTPLQLGQLTGLTCLDYNQQSFSRPVASPLVVEADDELPPNLLELFIADCSSTQPLQHLSKLTFLTVSAAASMKLLPQVVHGLPSLQHLLLRYAAAPSQVAEPAPSAEVPSIPGGDVHRLRRLDISNLLDSAALVATAKVLQQLTGLTTLSLQGKQQAAQGVSGPAHYEPAAVHQLVAAAAKLPQLQELILRSIGLYSVAAKLLAAAVSTRLISLTLIHVSLTDINLCTICCGLTQLVRLDVMGNAGLVFQGLLPFMVKFMPSLRDLYWDTERVDIESNAYSRELIDLINHRRD